jgi:hypothetical protein
MGGRSSLPCQTVTQGESSKHGSIQKFMTSIVGMSFDLAIAQQFVPVEQVHRIATLNVRVNSGLILASFFPKRSNGL